MDLDLERLRSVFAAETQDGLAAMEESLLALEAHPADSESLATVFRVVHTIKGGASALGVESLGDFAHRLENLLSLLRAGDLPVTPVRITLLLQAVDAMRGMMEVVGRGQVHALRQADQLLLDRLDADRPEDVEAAVPLPPLAGAVAGMVAGDAGATPVAADAAPGGTLGARIPSLRVRMERLDALLTLTGEIAVARSALAQRVQGAATAGDVRGSVEELERLLSELQAHVLQLRLVPIGPVFRQHLRTVRDIAAAHGKLIELHLEGEEVELDAAAVELLRDPLTHMVRNAVDHGVEHVATRHAAGKSPAGTVTLRARHEHGAVIIEVADDGAGIDRAKVLAQGRARGIIGADAASEADLVRCMVSPGFSTADHVTELSGRGVGMDVVRRNVDALRGSLNLSTTPGGGTTFSLRVPLTLAILQGLAVEVGSQRYVVPLDAVTECLDVPAGVKSNPDGSGLLDVRGHPLPFLRLRQLFRATDAPARRENLIAVRVAGESGGLVVDRVLGELESIIRPLGKLFDRVRGFSGSTILGDGRVALVLDVAALLADARAAAAAASAAASDSATTDAPQPAELAGAPG
ncbi:MAG TPA: chemotaxis protein CheA [Gemmatimonadaceae bacterium]